MACEDSGDRDGMVAECSRPRLDVEGDDDERELGTAEFARVVQDALDELPPEVLERLRNVPLIADDRPSEEMVRDGTDPRILGLFHGLSMPHESTLGPAFRHHPPFPVTSSACATTSASSESRSV